MAKADWKPKDRHSVIPYLTVRDAKAAIDFYIGAFGAKELVRMAMPDGKLMHAELQLGDAHIMLADEFPEMGSHAPSMLSGSPVTVHLYVPDVDAAIARAEAHGAKITFPPTDMFWGDRFAKLSDPFGHQWSLATHQRDPSPEEMRAAMQRMAGA